MKKLFIFFQTIFSIVRLFKEQKERLDLIEKENILLKSQFKTVKKELDFYNNFFKAHADISMNKYDQTVVVVSFLNPKTGQQESRFYDFPRGESIKEVILFLDQFKKVYMDAPKHFTDHFHRERRGGNFYI